MSAPDPYAVGEEKTDMRISRDEFSWFKRIHSGLALFFTGFAVFLFCFPYLSNNADVFKITLEWPLVLTRDVKELGSFRFTRFLAPFTVITATAHAIHAFYYLRSDKNELSPLWWRWAEYSFSASWMLVCIATISGIKDTLILFTMGVLMMTTQFFGHLLPVQVTTKGWVTWGLGCVPYMVSWAPLIVYYAQLAEVAPWFVPWILFVMFGLFTSFAVVWPLWKTSAKREYTYVMLSVVSKTTLVILVVSAIMRGDK